MSPANRTIRISQNITTIQLTKQTQNYSQTPIDKREKKKKLRNPIKRIQVSVHVSECVLSVGAWSGWHGGILHQRDYQLITRLIQ